MFAKCAVAKRELYKDISRLGEGLRREISGKLEEKGEREPNLFGGGELEVA